jgi:hypothetical protein
MILLVRVTGVVLLLGAVASMLLGRPGDYLLLLAFGAALLLAAPPLPPGRSTPGILLAFAWILLGLGAVALVLKLVQPRTVG